MTDSEHGPLSGRVAFITGAARGQGRLHALTLANAGADIVALDICAPVGAVAYAMATKDDLDETAALVEATGRRIVCGQADVRDRESVDRVAALAVEELGRIDVTVCNAGAFAWTGEAAHLPSAWDDTLDVNLRGVYNTIEATLPAMLSGGRGGSIVVINSLAGLRPMIDDYQYTSIGYVSYIAAKHGAVGLANAYALMLARHNVRVNSLHPMGVLTKMIENDQVRNHMAAMGHSIKYKSPMPNDRIEPQDVSNAVLWLASDDSRYITGTSLPLDSGTLLQ